MSATRAMAEYLVKLDYADVPEEVWAKCKELILDSLACGVGGSRTPIGLKTADLARKLGGHAQATILGAGFKTALNLAAFVNASAINALDYDDTGKGGHPGSSVIPAVLALGEWLEKDGRSILLACLAGYEIGTRVAAAIEPTWERYRQIHGVGTAQTFGAMAGCAKLLGLDLEETLNAFGVAGASAPVAHAGKFGWTDKSIAFVKDNVALPAETGLRAALLAQLGYEGSESILDGDRGYWVMAGSDQCDFTLLTDFGHWEVLGVSLKPYPCCRWIHTTLDAVTDLRREHSFRVEDIAAVNIFSNEPVAQFFGRTSPRTFVDVEFSIPCTVALKLLEVPHAQWFREENWARPEALALARKVTVSLDESYQKLYLELNRQAARIPVRVEIRLGNGQCLTAYCDEATGSPRRPLSREERLAKVRDLLGCLLSPEAQEKFIGRVERLEELENIGTLLSGL